MSPGRIVLPVPVHERVVEVELQPRLVARLRELAEDVALEWSVRDVVAVVDLCRPEGKAVVVARGDRHVLCARVLEDSHPLLRVELRRIEPVHHAAVGLGLDAILLLIPFALRVVGVEPPVDEDSEALRGKFVAGLEIPFFRCVVGVKRGCGGEGGGGNGFFHRIFSLQYLILG